jgi:hypothetical protein
MVKWKEQQHDSENQDSEKIVHVSLYKIRENQYTQKTSPNAITCSQRSQWLTLIKTNGHQSYLPCTLIVLCHISYHTPHPLDTLKHQMIYPIQQHNRANQYARELEYRDLVPRLCHAR